MQNTYQLTPTPSRRFRVSTRASASFGFSLIEIAMVLVIISILLAMVAVPLAAQVEQRRMEETQRLLDGVKDALYGFAMANGRLPCPATAGTAGVESPVGGGACTALVGFLPAVTLGITPVDSSGFAIDAWVDGTTARRIGYAVSNSNSNALTTADGVRNATMAIVGAATHLYVCALGLTGTPPATTCGAMTTLTSTAPAVIFSLGKDSANTPFDQANNQNGDKVFSSGTPNATFDDLVTWISLNTLFDRMGKAGKLP